MRSAAGLRCAVQHQKQRACDNQISLLTTTNVRQLPSLLVTGHFLALVVALASVSPLHLHILTHTFLYLGPVGTEDLTADERTALVGMLPSLFLFAVTWSLGATCDRSGRAAFDKCVPRLSA